MLCFGAQTCWFSKRNRLDVESESNRILTVKDLGLGKIKLEVYQVMNLSYIHCIFHYRVTNDLNSSTDHIKMEMKQLMGVGLLLRVGLILYGEWQDRTMAVKFTDVDYFVFHDAAAYMYEGKSPYLRSTYRYTPLLAWILQPNIWLTPLFGKILFILLDCGTAYLIYSITRTQNNVSNKQALVCSSFWLFNPLPLAVSSRGNAESLMTCLVLLCLQCLLSGNMLLTGCVFALAVHIKIYPVIYVLPIYLLLWDIKQTGRKTSIKGISGTVYRMLYPTMDRICFILVTTVTLIALTGCFYYLYGWEFLHHTYLYHVTRKDIRHNFSPYFYMLYLQSGVQDSIVIGLMAFIPQVVLLLVFSFKFYKELNLVFFLNTFAFVTFNKVCTSQYFLWYLCFLPGLIPHLTRISLIKAAFLFGLWFAGQGVWLLPAYYLEFEGHNSFLYIWLAGLAFFVINCYILYEIIDNYSCVPPRGKNTENATRNIENELKTQTGSNKAVLQSTTQLKPQHRSDRNMPQNPATDLKSRNSAVTKITRKKMKFSDSSEDSVSNVRVTRSHRRK